MRTNRRYIFFLTALIVFCFGVLGCQRVLTPSAQPPLPSAGSTVTWHDLGARVETFPLIGQTKLTLENPYGSVKVTPGGQALEVEIAQKVMGDGSREMRRRAQEIKVVGEPDPKGGFKLAVEGDLPSSETQVDLMVTAPPEVALQINVAAGAVKVSGFRKPVSISGKSGPVKIEDCREIVDIHVESGNVSVRGLAKSASIYTSSGNITVDGGQGSLLCRTMSGDIELRDFYSDAVVATTQSGKITMRALPPFSGKMEARSDSGDISLALNSASNCRLTTTTASGNITNSLPLRNVQRAGPNISGRLGAGKGSVLVTTRSGNIELSASETQ